MKSMCFALLLVPAVCSAQVRPAAPAALPALAARHIRAGETIAADALKDAAAPDARGVPAAQAAGAEAVRSIRPGELITALMLRPARLVKPGDRVKVRGRAGRVTVYAWFLALQGGALGELIQARNQSSGKTVTVKVEGPGEAGLAEEGR